MSGNVVREKWLVRQIMQVCGFGRMLVGGDFSGRMVSDLLLSGSDVNVIADAAGAGRLEALFPGRVLSGPAADREGDEYDHVILVGDGWSPDQPHPLLKRGTDAARRVLMIVISGEHARPSDRATWEALLIRSGMRKHPLTDLVAPYSTLDMPSESIILLFEPVPAEAARAYPLDVLIAERDLHMDMTREPGRRSDAHMCRYVHASTFVRPGDRILDLACGLGYGSHVLSAGTEGSSFLGIDASDYAVEYAAANFAAVSQRPMVFRVGDAERLDGIEDQSLDFAVSVETLEHLRRPEALLAELHRVLTAGGRAYLSVPFDWADETGEDPNPHHFHVYHWSDLRRQAVDAGFEIERAWTQDAGGGQKLHDAYRGIFEFDPEEGPQRDGEWLVALVMKPLGTAAGERADAVKDVPNIVAFDRDYQNPALLRGLVSIGWRATDPRLLERFARDVLAHEDERTADYGAALCVLGYRILEREATFAEKKLLVERALRYADGEPANPTAYRWQVSLLFVAALLLQSAGMDEDAQACLVRVTESDVSEFSPLLGTKTVSAAMLLGQKALARGQEEAAAQWWWWAIGEAKRLVESANWGEVLGPEDDLQTFGMPELADILLMAGKAVSGIKALQVGAGQPSMVWKALDSTLDARHRALQIASSIQNERLDIIRSGYEQAIRGLMDQITDVGASNAWLDSQYWAQTEAISKLNHTIDSLSTELAAQDQSMRVARLDFEQQIRRVMDQVALLGQSKAWLEGQYTSQGAEIARLQDVVTSLTTESESLLGQNRSLAEKAELIDQGRAWLEGQRSSLIEHAESLSRENDELRRMLSAAQGAGTLSSGNGSGIERTSDDERTVHALRKIEAGIAAMVARFAADGDRVPEAIAFEEESRKFLKVSSTLAEAIGARAKMPRNNGGNTGE